MTEINAHVDRQRNETIDGVTFTNTHSGQERAYGDTYYRYDVHSERPADEVEKVCRERVYKCSMSEAEWREKGKTDHSMERAFTPHYTFRSLGGGKYFYQVCMLYTD